MSALDPQSVQIQPEEPARVQLIEACGQWWVRVVEQGVETCSMAFARESYALSFAEEQQLRLGLSEVVRV
jgi:hypothetical protein